MTSRHNHSITSGAGSWPIIDEFLQLYSSVRAQRRQRRTDAFLSCQMPNAERETRLSAIPEIALKDERFVGRILETFRGPVVLERGLYVMK